MDHEPLAESPAIEIYRASLATGATPDKKTAWRLVYTIPSERVDAYLKGDRVEFHDLLTPKDFASSAGARVAYMARTRAAKTRDSGDSNYIEAHIYPAPEAPRDIRINVTKAAIELFWTAVAPQQTPAPVTYRVFRGEIDSGTQPAAQDLSPAKLKSPSGVVGVSPSPDFSDAHFEFGHTYLYTVRAVAQHGPDSVESEESSPSIITPQDTFPPATPTGLEAAIIPAASGTPAYVELSWAIGSEPDLAGYYVYRGDREDEPGERISAEILPSPTSRDSSVAGGRRYFYRVSAVNRAGNESSKSSAVQVDVP